MGLDVPCSLEVDSRTAIQPGMVSYDGVRIPFADGSIDMVYSRQVFEYVRRPSDLLAEVRRVLRADGLLVLTASFLEPYHSCSYWGYTPYGFHALLVDAGFGAIKFRPGIDGVTLILRRLLRRPSMTDRWFRMESHVNRLLSFYGAIRRKPHAWINERKLQLCGHFCVVARKI